MKKNLKYFYSDLLLSALGLAAHLMYGTFISIASVAASIASDTYKEPDTIINVSRIFGIEGLVAIAIFVLISILSYFFMKKANKKGLVGILILSAIALVVLIIKNIYIFV